MATSGAIADDRTGEIAIFARLIKADAGDLSRDLARYLLTLGFDEEDQARMSELAERNQEGTWIPGSRSSFRTSSRPGHCLPCSIPRPGSH